MTTNNKKNILITGCSSGFGLLLAARLSSKGHKVIATMRNLAKKKALLEEVAKRGGSVDLLKLDVTNLPSIKDTINHIQTKYHHLDVLINNAGYGIVGSFEDLDDSDMRGIMETNFFGVMNVTREALPLLHKSQQAKIINMSSISGFTTYPWFSAYNASKWALEAFSESLMYELKAFGIDVVLVEPGTYRTEIFYANRRYAKNFHNPQSHYYHSSQRLEQLINKSLKKNKRDPEQVAFLVEKLINAPKTRFRNIPDLDGKFLYILRKILPFSFYSWILYNLSRKFMSKK